jgi:hypothetical protein
MWRKLAVAVLGATVLVATPSPAEERAELREALEEQIGNHDVANETGEVGEADQAREAGQANQTGEAGDASQAGAHEHNHGSM